MGIPIKSTILDLNPYKMSYTIIDEGIDGLLSLLVNSFEPLNIVIL